MSLLQRHLTFDEVTEVEWRRLDGTVLQRMMLALPGGRTWLLLEDVRGPYDIYARAHGGDWRLIYEVRPQPDGGLIVDWKTP